ncbi:dihydrofolate reductase [Aureliella helgolandensis]|uniref:Dihydrofolate reductase n=1 Tax=Aureliella helgolandensis TaxID=2527968 RepID=A0A518G8K1_9BACT|nr:dihydrofolate reductase [Aureliella helgolandensis]QDV24910.1 Dihydrofolate reductase [Aureliella helgolandensis]
MHTPILPSDSSGWTLVVGIGRGGIIGNRGALPWRVRSDLQRFKRMTMGHCLLMGRKTYDSIGRPLPGRQTIVLSRSVQSNLPQDVAAVSNLNDVASLVQPHRKVMVVGGAEVYRAALSRCDRMWITRICADVEGDTVFPEIDWHDWTLERSQMVEADPQDEWPTEFEEWIRKPAAK